MFFYIEVPQGSAFGRGVARPVNRSQGFGPQLVRSKNDELKLNTRVMSVLEM